MKKLFINFFSWLLKPIVMNIISKEMKPINETMDSIIDDLANYKNKLKNF